MGDMDDYLRMDEWSDDWYPDDYPDHYERPARAEIQCKYCGEDELSWMLDDKGNWKLGKGGVVHVCCPFPEEE